MDPTRDSVDSSRTSPEPLDPDRESIWNIPNQLTIARLVLSVVFFVLLALENHGKTFGKIGQMKIDLLLNISIAVFVLAVVTDFLDGYLARKWKLTSTFGRIADPFADKIVVCGAFIMLTGVTPRMVEPWFAVVIIFREFLVSGLRSYLESHGVAFGAALSGKLKMVVQSVTIPLVLFYQANLAPDPVTGQETDISRAFYWLTMCFLALTLIFTVTSSIGYIHRAMRLIQRSGAHAKPED